MEGPFEHELYFIIVLIVIVIEKILLFYFYGSFLGVYMMYSCFNKFN